MNIFLFLVGVFIFTIIVSALVVLLGEEILIIFGGYLLIIVALYTFRNIFLFSTVDSFIQIEMAEFIISMYNILCNWISVIVALIISIIFGVIKKVKK